MFGGARGLVSCKRSLQQPAAAKGFWSVEAKYSGEKNRVRSFFKRENYLDWPCGGLLLSISFTKILTPYLCFGNY